MVDRRLPRLKARPCQSSRADRFDAAYLRAAQAYMLISMPTGTSTILGVFQVIAFLPTSFGADFTPEPNLEGHPTSRKHVGQIAEPLHFSLGQSGFSLG
jgi:hypothetical protein